MLTATQFDQWVAALESEKYPQAVSQLKANLEAADGTMSVGYCCLGVLAQDVLGVDLDSTLYPTASTVAGDLGGVEEAPVELESAITTNLRGDLAKMNDAYGFSFPEIAAYLREHRSDYVSE